MIFLSGAGGASCLPMSIFPTWFRQDSGALDGRNMHWARNAGSMAVFLMSPYSTRSIFPLAMAIERVNIKLWNFTLMCCPQYRKSCRRLMGFYGLGPSLRAIGIEV
jgi:hypothetical protein